MNDAEKRVRIRIEIPQYLVDEINKKAKRNKRSFTKELESTLIKALVEKR